LTEFLALVGYRQGCSPNSSSPGNFYEFIRPPIDLIKEKIAVSLQNNYDRQSKTHRAYL
jgi:hypothetical protein